MHRLQLAFKRLVDIVLCTLVLLLSFPVLALIAAMIRISSPGSVFFVQQRVGQRTVPFAMLKFRTMADKPVPRSAKAWTADDEARITPIGSILRDFGLDELPQTINILKGDMSIIGPRPPLPEQLEDYTEYQKLAFNMRPGVLSWAAVKGRRTLPVEQRRDLHAWYVENWSLWLDLRILLRSLMVVLRREDAREQIAKSNPSGR